MLTKKANTKEKKERVKKTYLEVREKHGQRLFFVLNVVEKRDQKK